MENQDLEGLQKADLPKDSNVLNGSPLTALRTIGLEKLRPREIYLRLFGSDLSKLDVNESITHLLDICLIDKTTNGFDCLYGLTPKGLEIIGEKDVKGRTRK